MFLQSLVTSIISYFNHWLLQSLVTSIIGYFNR